MKKSFYTLLTTLMLVFGCGRAADICGSWVEPVEGQPGMVQGIELRADHSARSIGMATLLFERWQLSDDKLILSGESIGNGQTIAFSDTLAVVRLTPDSLLLSRGAHLIRLARQGQ
ncbi:MAG: lipocalin family protein [Tidjanibacter sp.]|nr:lipocalin family protein [Tidjanibacter sp.]